MFSLNEGLAFQVHGGDHDEGLSAMLGDFLAVLEGVTSGRMDLFGALLPGVVGMANIHPLIVHFPIALLTLFLLVELAACVFRQPKWYRVAGAMLYIGTAFAALAVYFGMQAAETVAHGEAVHEVMEKHETFGFTILGVAWFLSLWRAFFDVHSNLLAQITFLLGALVLNVLIILGADLGGVMVYQHGVAVNSTNSVTTPALENVSEGHHGHHHGEHAHE